MTGRAFLGPDRRDEVQAMGDENLCTPKKLARFLGSRLGKLVARSCLAPDIITAIVEGKQPATLTTKSLSAIALPKNFAGAAKGARLLD